MITPETFPAGTRVISLSPGSRGAYGVVTGWVRESIGVKWDNGGSQVGPASHGHLKIRPKVNLIKAAPLPETPREQFVRMVGELHDAINATCQAEFANGAAAVGGVDGRAAQKAVADARAIMWRKAYALYDFGPQEED